MKLDKLAERVAQREGGKVNLNIAQIKEVIACLNEQVIQDTGGGINLYAMLRASKEPGDV